MSNPTASIALLAAHTSGIRITLARAGLLERAQSPLINRKKGAPPPTIYEWTSTLYILQAPLAQAAASVAAGRETTEADAMAWADDIDLADALARLQAAIAAAKRLNVATIAAGGGEEDGGDGPGKRTGGDGWLISLAAAAAERYHWPLDYILDGIEAALLLLLLAQPGLWRPERSGPGLDFLELSASLAAAGWIPGQPLPA